MRSIGSVYAFFPNKLSLASPAAGGNQLRAGVPVMIPDPYAGFSYVIDPPAGQGTLIAVLADKPVTSVDVPPTPRALGEPEEALEYIGRIADELIGRDLTLVPGTPKPAAGQPQSPPNTNWSTVSLRYRIVP